MNFGWVDTEQAKVQENEVDGYKVIQRLNGVSEIRPEMLAVKMGAVKRWT